MSDPVIVSIEELTPSTCRFSVLSENTGEPVWIRLNSALLSYGFEHEKSSDQFSLSWPDGLRVVREFGSRSSQRSLNFRFRPIGSAADTLKSFAEEIVAMRTARVDAAPARDPDELRKELVEKHFTKRTLREFQLRDLSRLLSLQNGANFSVPGAGKTTVTFALHLLFRTPGSQLFVVAPKAAFPAWKAIVRECIDDDAPHESREEFLVIDGKSDETQRLLNSGRTRFLVSYDFVIRNSSTLANHFASCPTHLVLDESHRMKAGYKSQRGAFLLSIASLPIRRDILSGTPMPQAASDIESQLDFLWPGHGLGAQVSMGRSPREVLGPLYVRTTKQELGLPKADRHFIDVPMSDAQLALYSIVREEFLRDYSKAVGSGLNENEVLKARRSVMRLLQLSTNPSLALTGMSSAGYEFSSGIVDQILEEGNSEKLRRVIKHARELAHQGEKTVIWTIFTGTIHSLEASLAELSPVLLYGGVPSGSDDDISTREGRLRKFHEDESCSVLIANPAAAGEGISLHTVCHNAIYVDRSYVSTHYLQSIDRIHRLGLKPDQRTDIHIYRTRAPAEIGSIDLSVSRRLAEKIRNMQDLLNDTDLHEIAFDEEEADDPIDYDVELQDIVDLIAELEGRSEALPDDEQ